VPWTNKSGRLGSDVVMQLFLVMMAVASAKEPLIAGRAAIRVLKHHKVAEPIFDAASFRTKELFATAIRATGGLGVRSGFVHGKILCRGRLSYTLGGRTDEIKLEIMNARTHSAQIVSPSIFNAVSASVSAISS